MQVRINESSTVGIDNVQFINSYSTGAPKQWGGALHLDSSLLVLTNSIFTNPVTPFGGGALFGYLASTSITNVTIINAQSLNHKPGSMRGGGIWWQSGVINMTNVSILSSQISSSKFDGGALAVEYEGSSGFWNGGTVNANSPNAVYMNLVVDFTVSNLLIIVSSVSDISNDV